MNGFLASFIAFWFICLSFYIFNALFSWLFYRKDTKKLLLEQYNCNSWMSKIQYLPLISIKKTFIFIFFNILILFFLILILINT